MSRVEIQCNLNYRYIRKISFLDCISFFSFAIVVKWPMNSFRSWLESVRALAFRRAIRTGGRERPPPDFGRYVDPISIKGADYAHKFTTRQPFPDSYGPGFVKHSSSLYFVEDFMPWRKNDLTIATYVRSTDLFIELTKWEMQNTTFFCNKNLWIRIGS